MAAKTKSVRQTSKAGLPESDKASEDGDAGRRMTKEEMKKFTADWGDPAQTRWRNERAEEVRKAIEERKAAGDKRSPEFSKIYRNLAVKVLNYESVENYEKRFIDLMKSVAKEASESPHLADDLPQVVESLLKAHFNRYHQLNPPPVPERKYVPRQDEIIPFLYDVWGDWIASGRLTKPTLRQHDKRAYTALQNWLRHNDLPAEIAVRNNWEVNDEFAQREWFHRDEIVRATGALYRRTPDQ
ncbi:hypothetical protein [Novosphingobium naphthalenivorans]|uniref:hypothetical protein n=1 Tax=Novosphingobium naphthalenivorans TaxID=273168 RepID=UPI000B20EF44|nr:hypothetical protein [Novosphingobium naphthalenivorans]